MDYIQEVPLAAGLLTAFASTVVPTPTFLPSAASPWSQPSPTSTSPPGFDNGGEGGGHYEWSSLIGISTALVGNVLISLALNIQRYAHIRINKEWENDKLQKELDWKRAHHSRCSSGPYGTVENRSGGRDTGHSNSSSRYRDESPDRLGSSAGSIDDDSGQHDHLQASTFSDRTMRPGSQELQYGNRKSYLRSPYWWVGIVLMTLGEAGNFMAYGFAPASIVSPLGVVALISNCIIAPCLLKEQFRKRDFWGVLVAIAGAVIVVLSANSSEEKIGPHDIWVMITRWEFELYLGITAALIVGLMWASGKYGSQTILIDVGLVGLFGGYTALSTKGVSSLLSFTLWHVITFPITYLLVFVLVFSALMQIRYINRALQRFDSTQVIPTQFVLFTLSVIIGSAVLYRDFQSFTPERSVKFVGGCLLTFLGVYFITSGRVRADDESSYSDDEEESIGLFGRDRYQDRVDMSPPSPHVRGKNRSLPKTPELPGDGLQSPSGSLPSHGIEGLDDNTSTPRAALSTASQSPRGSLTAESLSEPSLGSSASSSRSHSLLRNPWVDSSERTHGTTAANAQLPRPLTPPRQSGHRRDNSTLQFRFPSAPGVGEGDPPATASGSESVRPITRNHAVPQTPPARRARNSISSHFSPGPLLPTISAGFSAVVAESLRRGEVSPAHERRAGRRGGRKKLLSTTNFDLFREQESGGGNTNPNTDSSLFNRHDPPFSMATTRLDSTDDLATAPVSAGHSTPGLASGEESHPPHENDITTFSRLRSLSDSWSRGFPWLGGTINKSSENHGSGNVSLIEANASSESQDRNDHQDNDPNARA